MVEVTSKDQPYYALHLDRPDFIYAGNLLWLTPLEPIHGAGVGPFPQRLQ